MPIDRIIVLEGCLEEVPAGDPIRSSASTRWAITPETRTARSESMRNLVAEGEARIIVPGQMGRIEPAYWDIADADGDLLAAPRRPRRPKIVDFDRSVRASTDVRAAAMASDRVRVAGDHQSERASLPHQRLGVVEEVLVEEPGKIVRVLLGHLLERPAPVLAEGEHRPAILGAESAGDVDIRHRLVNGGHGLRQIGVAADLGVEDRQRSPRHSARSTVHSACSRPQ